MQLVWSRRANRDLDHIYNYIAKDNPLAALDMLDTILAAVENLSEYPKIGRPGRTDTTRELVIPSTPYIAVYIVSDQIIEIAAVLHTAKQWPEDFG